MAEIALVDVYSCQRIENNLQIVFINSQLPFLEIKQEVNFQL